MMEKPAYISELSQEANRLIKCHYPHYRYLNISATCARTAISSWITAIILAVFGCLHDFWWGIPIALVTMFVMARVANVFNPKYQINTKEGKIAHEEIINYLVKARSAARKESLFKIDTDKIFSENQKEKPEKTQTNRDEGAK